MLLLSGSVKKNDSMKLSIGNLNKVQCFTVFMQREKGIRFEREANPN